MNSIEVPDDGDRGDPWNVFYHHSTTWCGC